MWGLARGFPGLKILNSSSLLIQSKPTLVEERSGSLFISRQQYMCVCVCVRTLMRLVVQSCPILDCSPPGTSVHGDPPGKNTGICFPLLQGKFTMQGLNLGLQHCRRILYPEATREAQQYI